MIDYELAKIFIKYDGFRYIYNKGPYYIVYFSETSTFMKDRDKLSFRQLDFQHILLSNTTMPRIHLNGEIIQEYRDVKLTAHTINNKPKNKNILVDPTAYVASIDKRYPTEIGYRNRYGDMIYSFIIKLFQQNENLNAKKIFFYSVDKSVLKTKYNKNKFFIFLQTIRKNKLFFDDLILCILNGKKKPTYRKLIIDQHVNYEKILYYIRNI